MTQTLNEVTNLLHKEAETPRIQQRPEKIETTPIEWHNIQKGRAQTAQKVAEGRVRSARLHVKQAEASLQDALKAQEDAHQEVMKQVAAIRKYEDEDLLPGGDE